MRNVKTIDASMEPNASVSVSTAFLIHSICGLGLAASLWTARGLLDVNLVSDPVRTIRLAWVAESSLQILFYSLLRQNRDQCSYWKAVGRGVLGLPIGALLMASGAIALGAPVGIQYFAKTVNWSLLMSSLTFVPAVSVFGSSWKDWQRLFADTRPSGVLDYMICIPALGTVIGAWIGAWPMPLDWERPWQEWPICVTYGTVAGYLIGLVASFGFILVLHMRKPHAKGD